MGLTNSKLLEKVKDELDEVRKAGSDNDEQHRKQLDAICAQFNTLIRERDGTIKEMRTNHNDTVNAMSEEKKVELQKKEDRIINDNRHYLETISKMVQSHSALTAIAYEILTNVVMKAGVERDAICLNAKIDNMRQVTSRMENQRRKIVDWLAENDLKMLNDSAVQNSEIAQTLLKSMAEDCSTLESLIKEAIQPLSYSGFDRDLIKTAKGILISCQDYSADLFDEIAASKSAMKTPRSVSLAGIKGCLKKLTRAINSFPSMVTQTTNDYILEEMKNLKIKDEEFLNTAIAFNPKIAPAIEEKPVTAPVGEES